MSRKGNVYTLICPINNEVRYVGITVRKLEYRLSAHLRNLKYANVNSHKDNWLKTLKKINILDKLKIISIEECQEEFLNEREVYWIAYYKAQGANLTNITPGGTCGSLGYKHTDEAKRKISIAASKKGYKMSIQARKNISKSLLGNTRRLNKKHTEETKKKISKSKKGTVPWNKTSVYQYDK